MENSNENKMDGCGFLATIPFFMVSFIGIIVKYVWEFDISWWWITAAPIVFILLIIVAVIIAESEKFINSLKNKQK